MEDNNECLKERLNIAKEFEICKKAIIAIGDETRHRIIMTLLQSETIGLRVGEISKKANLSRPAISHHLQILKKAKIISMKKQGTKNYYYINADETEWDKLSNFMNNINSLVKKANKNNYPNNIMKPEDYDD